MGNKFRFKVSLRLRHPHADLSAIGEKLCADFGAPLFRYARKAGELRHTPDGQLTGGHYHESAYSVAFPIPKGATLERFLATQLDRLATHHRDTLAHIVASGGSLSFFIGWFSGSNSGETFPVSTLRAMADLHIALGLDVYAEDTVDDDDDETDRTAT